VAASNGAPIELHLLLDAVITSSGNINRIRNIHPTCRVGSPLPLFENSIIQSLKSGQKKAMRLP